MSVMLFPCIFLCCSVNGSVCLVCCVFVNCLVKQLALCLGVVAILLLNVMDGCSFDGGALLDRPCMVFHRMCVLCLLSKCASKCSCHMLCFCFCMSEVETWITSVCSPYVVSLGDIAYYVVG